MGGDIVRRCLQSLLLTVTVFTALVNGQASVQVPPSNSAGFVGENLNLTCRLAGYSSESFLWNEFITSSTGSKIFSAPGGDVTYPSKHTIYGQFDLGIMNLKLSDAGLYACVLWGQDPHGLHVFVFDQHILTVPAMKDGETHEVQCQSTFGANAETMLQVEQRPKMRLEIKGNTLDNLDTEYIENGENTYTIIGRAEYIADWEDDESEFKCIMTMASVVGYEAVYSQILRVEYGAQQPELKPENSFYYVGEQINCSSEGNPNPNYQWRSIETPGEEITISGPYLIITEEMIWKNDDGTDRESTWECTATNIVGGITMTDSAQRSFTVIREKNGGGSSGEDGPTAVPDEGNTGESSGGPEAWKIGVGVGVPIAIITIGAAVAAGVIVSRKRKRDKAAGDHARKMPPPEIGNVNTGGVFPGDGELVNGTKPKGTETARTPISSLPDPTNQSNPTNRGKDSPGYADLGIKQITDSYPGVNVSINSSMDSFEDVNTTPTGPPLTSRQQPPPPAARQPPPGALTPQSHVNRNFQSESPPVDNRGRPNYLNVGPNHPDTFV